MRFAIIVSTYNRPDALELVLRSIRLQMRQPDEIIIADDGSAERTAQVVRQWQIRLNINHIWHEDRGFRLAAIRNKAIKAAKADYLLIIDGDMVLDPHVVKDHLRAVKPDQWVQGSRVMLGPERTDAWLRDPDLSQPQLFTSGISNRLNTIKHNGLSRIFSRSSTRTDNLI